jgi:hypothetical protein
MKCNQSDCNRKSVSRGLCDKHYRRLLRYGSADLHGSRKVAEGNEIERFHQKYKIQENGCWIWQAGTRANSKGDLYGRHWLDNGKIEGAHRFSYFLSRGFIPDGAYICHKCDNPLCVNPDHLFASNHAGNMRDMVEKNRSYRGRGEDKKGLAKLSNTQAAEIKKSNLKQSHLAEMYGVAQTTISRIKRGVSY